MVVRLSVCSQQMPCLMLFLGMDGISVESLGKSNCQCHGFSSEVKFIAWFCYLLSCVRFLGW